MWSTKYQKTFEKLQELCTSRTVLAYADFTKPFKMQMDACGTSLEAVLYQTQVGKDRVISYASWILSKSVQKYPVHKLEFMALKWAVTDHLHEYLYGNSIEVYTDNNCLTCILISA